MPNYQRSWRKLIVDRNSFEFPHPPAPSPTARGRGGASTNYDTARQNHGMKPLRLLHGSGNDKLSSLTPSPSPTARGRGGASTNYDTARQNHGMKPLACHMGWREETQTPDATGKHNETTRSKSPSPAPRERGWGEGILKPILERSPSPVARARGWGEGSKILGFSVNHRHRTARDTDQAILIVADANFPNLGAPPAMQWCGYAGY